APADCPRRAWELPDLRDGIGAAHRHRGGGAKSGIDRHEPATLGVHRTRHSSHAPSMPTSEPVSGQTRKFSAASLMKQIRSLAEFTIWSWSVRVVDDITTWSRAGRLLF